MDFILDQYRTCWGWALSMGITTSLEVFDTRWSQCHAWAGCPTWQLSRYGLGLWPRFDLGPNHFELKLISGSLKSASGLVPVPNGDPIKVEWKKVDGDRIAYQITSSSELTLHSKNQGSKVVGSATFELRKTDSTWFL
jgi:hypothetical protein